MKGVATAETVAHEIGWHATFHWAEKHAPALHAKLMQYAREATDGVKQSVRERYGSDLDERVLLDEIGAERFTREDISPLLDGNVYINFSSRSYCLENNGIFYRLKFI